MSDQVAAPLAQTLVGSALARQPRLAEIMAVIFSLGWFVVCVLVWLRPGVEWSGVFVLVWLIGFFVPIGLVWLAVATVRTAFEVREEGEHLRAALAEISRLQSGPKSTGSETQNAAVLQLLKELSENQNDLQDQVAALIDARTAEQPAVPAPVSQAPAEPQPSLSLGTPGEMLETPVTTGEFIAALNFPENEHDTSGFEMLRKALLDRRTRRLVRSSQDVLTLLSQDGIYMDDLRPDRARPEVWRAFAHGERGRAIAGLGGIHDRSSLALTSGRMKQDPVFRDATHHFLRAFDQTFLEFERHASDEDIIHLANTRTARAFMLLGRVTGTFD